MRWLNRTVTLPTKRTGVVKRVLLEITYDEGDDVVVDARLCCPVDLSGDEAKELMATYHEGQNE